MVELREPLEELIHFPRQFTAGTAFPRANEIRLYDTSLRDGEQTPGVAFAPEQKFELACMLSDAGVHMLDVGFPSAAPSERKSLQLILDAKKKGRIKSEIVVMCRSSAKDIDVTLDFLAGIGAKPHDASFFVFTSGSDLHLKYKIGKTLLGLEGRKSEEWLDLPVSFYREANIKMSTKAIEYARSRGVQVVGAVDEPVAVPVDQIRIVQLAEAKRHLEGELAQARGRQRLLAELSRADAERRRNLVDALSSVGLSDPKFLAEHADPVAGWERSLDFYLGALSDAVVLSSDLDPLAIASALAGRAGGQLITPIAQGSLANLSTPIADAAIALSVGEALGLNAELAAALPPAYLVRSADDARRLAAQHAGTAFLTREGVWVESGVFHIEGEIATPGVLERERDLADLGRQIPELETRLSVAIAELEGLVAERAALAKDVNRLQGEVSQLRQEHAVARARFEDAQARARRLATERETLISQRAVLSQEIERVGERGRQLGTELAEAESKHTVLQERFDAAQAGVESAKNARESLKTESAGRRGRLDLLIERLESHDRDTARLATEVEQGKRQIHGWKEEFERLGARRSDLESQIAEAEADLQSALEQRATAEEAVLADQERLDEQRQIIRDREESIAGVRQARERLRTEIEEFRVTQAGLEHDAEHLAALGDGQRRAAFARDGLGGAPHIARHV